VYIGYLWGEDTTRDHRKWAKDVGFMTKVA
jgi:hypothetical protein